MSNPFTPAQLWSLADQFGTPLWVYDAATIRQRIAQVSNFDTVRFAQKACSNIHILKLLREAGVKVDAVSRGEILRALADMASRRIGALVVLVRHQPIEHLLQVGTELDAKVTSELLDSIFLPYSPIHDGAVIIQRGKITRAGCLLPLSHNPDIAKRFGTRHRAALGLSELSDALVLVVSEESGKISAVHDGKISRIWHCWRFVVKD